MEVGLTTYKCFTALVFLCIYCPDWSLQTCDSSTAGTIICDNIVPATLPPKVTRVYLNIFATDIYLRATSFSHESWRNVTFLDITVQLSEAFGGRGYVQFGSMCFSSLNALEQLQMHGDQIETFRADTFHGVSHLKLLQFSLCRYLDTSYLFAALRHVNITVETLSLNDVSSATGKLCNVDSSFYELLQKMEVSTLSLRKTVFKVKEVQPWQIRPNQIQAIDISQTTIILPNTIGIHTLHNMFATFLQDLKSLNISAIPVQLALPNNDFLNNKTIRNCGELQNKILRILFLSVENLYADAIFKSPVIINNTLLNISDCPFNLRRWDFKKNKIQYFNITIYLPQHNKLNELDFSYNEIKYMSPNVTKTTKTLEILNMKSNELFQMEYFPEFNDLFASLPILKYLNIAENKLSYLPQGIFRNNGALETLDLADNKLTTIKFNLKYLKMLKDFNIARNRIKFLEGKALTNIQLFFKTRVSTGSNHTTAIEMAGNPFICSCDSAAFMEWIISFVQKQSERKYLCKMENEETEINKDSVWFANYLCYRTTIIICVSISVLILITAVILLTKFILTRKRRQKEKCERKHFLKEFQKGVLKEQYLCQISYSSEDEKCALDIIYANLNSALNRKCHCKREIICIGDKNFSLGRPIVDEILRCISESSVIVFVISKSFCGSRWCEMELREAYETGKPIILIFKEEVKTDTMSKLLLTVFNRITRAKLVENEGQYTLVPDWESLGEAIIKLATDQFIVKQETYSAVENIA